MVIITANPTKETLSKHDMKKTVLKCFELESRNMWLAQVFHRTIICFLFWQQNQYVYTIQLCGFELSGPKVREAPKAKLTMKDITVNVGYDDISYQHKGT